ncbi:MAG: sugar transporter [Odoribacter sp.]|nr:sugar transporter [Odoribacter sp.]
MKHPKNSEKCRIRSWLPVIGLTFSAFVFNTSEFVPIGLLSDIATDFQISEAHAGLLITIYAWVVALVSLPLMMLFSKWDYRKLLFMVIGLFIASHLLSAISGNYSILMVSRIGVACSHAIFWSIASPMAVQVAPNGQRATALSLLITGTSIAMIIGLPMGRVIGLHIGWRASFLCIAVAASAVFLLLACVFPKISVRNAISLHKLPSFLETPALMSVFILTLLLVTAHYTAYSYIEPFLGQIAGFSDNAITLVLVLFGLIGIIGSVLFSRYYNRNSRLFIRFAILGITLMLFLLYVSSFYTYTIIALCIVWGLAITLFNLIFQAEIIRLAPQATAIAMSVYSGIYNAGIGSGALLGGIVCSDLSISDIGYIGGSIAVIASVYCLKKLLPLLQKQ